MAVVLREHLPGDVSLRKAAEETGVKETSLRKWIEDGELEASGGKTGYLIQVPLPDELRIAHPRAFANAAGRIAKPESHLVFKVEAEWEQKTLRERATQLEEKLEELRQRLAQNDELIAWLRAKLDQAMAQRDSD